MRAERTLNVTEPLINTRKGDRRTFRQTHSAFNYQSPGVLGGSRHPQGRRPEGPAKDTHEVGVAAASRVQEARPALRWSRRRRAQPPGAGQSPWGAAGAGEGPWAPALRGPSGCPVGVPTAGKSRSCQCRTDLRGTHAMEPRADRVTTLTGSHSRQVHALCVSSGLGVSIIVIHTHPTPRTI